MGGTRKSPTTRHDGGRHPLTGEVASLITELAELAAERDDEDAEQLLSGVSGAERSGPATVVVVGEKKRGKSSLINALVERPGLLPVDADVASCVHLTVFYAPQAEAHVVDLASPGGRPIELAEVGEFAGLDPVTQEVRHPDVSHVGVGLPHPLLEGLSLVDTPGVGGLVSGHAAVTMAAIDRADALIFVVSGASELTSSECAFLASVTGRIATVLFVLTQIDKYPHWRQTLDRNRELIAAHAPGHSSAPWFAVSSLLREEAGRCAAEGNPDKAAEWLATSGFDGLETALRHRVARRAQLLHLANAVQVCERAAQEMLGAEELSLRSLRRDPALVAAADIERRRLKSLLDQGATWRTSLKRSFRSLEEDLTLRFHRGLNDLSARTAQRILDGGPTMINELPSQLVDSVQALWADLDAELRRRLSDIVREAASKLPADESLDAGLSVPERLRSLPELASTPPPGRNLASIEHGIAGTGAGLMVFGLIGWIAPLTGLAAGLGAGYFLHKRRKLREQLARDRASAKQHLQVIVAEMKTEFAPALKATLREVSERLEQLFTEQLTARRAELESAIAQSERAAQAAEEALAAERAVAQERVERLSELARRAARLGDELGSATAASVPAGSTTAGGE
ncbi:dynamin family protein [Dactylosporangium sp. AC04546]|uniref:dynamin family protein n=1 Tax=Dactylosporangium sp. AC04546 TaxID=2862460 RepID=UPI001EDFF64B|nr:dynamin family protein [Dactylosporangium sp. AC04546]WVK87013.1 dynamin family protein [Dactylosporangium sp. AC04546]